MKPHFAFQKNVISWLFAIGSVLLITGCWDYHELDNEAVISVFGYDLISPHHAKVSAYLETAPKANSSNNGNDGGMKQPEIIRADGPTIYEAIKNLSIYSPSELTFHHHVISILSEKFVTSHHFGDGLDRITRVGATRRRGQFAVTPGQASDVLEVKLPLTDDLSEGLLNLMDAAKEQQYSTSVDLNDFLYDMTVIGKEPILPRLLITKSKISPSKKLIKAYGSGAFRGTRFVGWLNGNETRGVLWLRGKSGHPILRFPWRDGEIMVQTESIHAKITLSQSIDARKERVPFLVKLKWQGKMVMYSGHRSLKIKDIPSIEQGVENSIRTVIQQSIRRTQALHTDVIGFGNILYSSQPTVYRQTFLTQWNDHYFPQIQYTMQIKAKILNIGMTSHAPEERD